TYQAVRKYGILEGCWSGLKRILKCQPFNQGGWDPLK
ncbi:MAG TPA: membrane protein insertion efficiency factor YidD, partial [Candidatus Portnoybacteria bacterium]|nr:membrane protein insertion efficiency factor YidD [Candidatus Portnoybacteria bacterium]